jgi:hypothetical protein
MTQTDKHTHTPGPWSLEKGSAGFGDAIFSTMDPLNTVADNVRNAANARLIAAAPDLLAACEWLVTAWEQSPDDQARIVVGIASERARDAIAKAKNND